MLSFKSAFSLFFFTVIKRFFSPSSLSAIKVVSSAYLKLLIFLPAILIPAYALSRCPFHHRGLECKSRKSRDTWSNKLVWPWSTNEARQRLIRVLPRECTGHSKHHLPTTQEKTLHMNITRWSTPKSD